MTGFGEGGNIELVPDLKNPEDLYGMGVNRAGTAAEPDDRSLV